MKAYKLAILAWMTCMSAGPVLLGQDEPSADLFTEAYTDSFQETFFEALKQKGIENYDRARALLLKCKEWENRPTPDVSPDNSEDELEEEKQDESNGEE